MKVVSLDQSTKVTGYSYMVDGKYVESGVIDLSKSKLETDVRSFEMAKSIWKIIRQYNPDHLVLEETQQQSNVKTVIILSRLQGMILGYAAAHGVKTHIIQPSRWRSALEFTQGPKVKRAELKQQSLDYVKEHIGIEMSEDEAESCCLGIAAHKIYDFE